MNKTAVALCLSLLAAPLAANAQVIDGSSDEAFEKSIMEMTEQIPEPEKDDFKGALLFMMLDRYPPAMGLEGWAAYAMLPQAIEAAPRTMSGVTLQEVRAEMDKIAARTAQEEAAERRAEAERAEAEAERRRAEEERRQQELEEQEDDEREAARVAVELECLQEKVTVTSLTIEPEGLRRDLRADVRNELPWAIAGLQMDVVATSPGRSVPWATESFILSIPGGIEPGETRELRSSIDLSRDAPADVEGNAKILDVIDPQMRQLIGEVGVRDWDNESTPPSCLDPEAAE